MIKITRLTDYGIMLLALFAQGEPRLVRTARDLAQEAHLPLPTVSKILKVLARKDILIGQRGMRGGFRLALPPRKVTVARIVSAVEGHAAITQCSQSEAGRCSLIRFCPVQSNWQRISQGLWGALEKITLEDMTRPMKVSFEAHKTVQKGF